MTATQPNSDTTEIIDAQNRVEAILSVLTAEIEAQSEHVALLSAQTEALKACDRAGYALLHERHERLLTDAENRSFRFKRLASESGESASLRDEIQRWPEMHRTKALELSSSLNSIAGEVSKLTERNSELIRGELRLILFQMNFILSSAQQDTSYASTGVNKTFQANRLLNSVA